MDAAVVFSALVEPRRREMLRLLRERPLTSREIRTRLSITQQAVSQHLQLLTAAGLVKPDHLGRGRHYALAADGFEAVDRFLSELWPDGLHRLKAVAERQGDD